MVVTQLRPAARQLLTCGVSSNLHAPQLKTLCNQATERFVGSQ